MEDEYRYYEILGLNRNASSSEISWRKGPSKTYHPDVSSHPRALENFQKIQQAYEALSDPRTRNEYDAYLDALEQSYPDDDFQPHFDGMDDIYIEHEFYAHNEPIIIRGQSYRLDYVRHLIISGREYIEYNGEHLPYDRGYFPFDTHTIDNEFYVSNEVIEIDGEEYTFATAHHVVITGQEYIEYNGEFLPFSRQEHPEPHQQGGGWLRKIAKLAIILVVAFTVYHGFLIGTSGTTATAGDDTGVPPPNPIRTTSPATSGSSKVVLAPTPVRTTSPEVKYSKLIADAMDPENPVTRNYALSLIDKSHGGERNIAQVCDIWEKVYNKWTYVSDPKGLEYFSSASNIKLGLKGTVTLRHPGCFTYRSNRRGHADNPCTRRRWWRPRLSRGLHNQQQRRLQLYCAVYLQAIPLQVCRIPPRARQGWKPPVLVEPGLAIPASRRKVLQERRGFDGVLFQRVLVQVQIKRLRAGGERSPSAPDSISHDKPGFCRRPLKPSTRITATVSVRSYTPSHLTRCRT